MSVKIHVWDGSSSYGRGSGPSFGHVALELSPPGGDPSKLPTEVREPVCNANFGGRTYYISYFDGCKQENAKSPGKLCHQPIPHFHSKEMDAQHFGRPPTHTVKLYALRTCCILEAFEKFVHTPYGFNGFGTGRLKKSHVYNCVGLTEKLLKKGGLYHFASRNTFAPLDRVRIGSLFIGLAILGGLCWVGYRGYEWLSPNLEKVLDSIFWRAHYGQLLKEDLQNVDQSYNELVPKLQTVSPDIGAQLFSNRQVVHSTLQNYPQYITKVEDWYFLTQFSKHATNISGLAVGGVAIASFAFVRAYIFQQLQPGDILARAREAKENEARAIENMENIETECSRKEVSQAEREKIASDRRYRWVLGSGCLFAAVGLIKIARTVFARSETV